MRKVLFAILVFLGGTAATAAADDSLSGAVAREQHDVTVLKLEGDLAMIADRDIGTARIEQDLAERQIDRARTAHDRDALVAWCHRREAANKAEADAWQAYALHKGLREDARADLRMASAEVRRIESQTATR